VIPTLIVFGVGAVIAAGCWVLACFRPQSRSLWAFAIVVGTFAVAASSWTFEFSIPASLAWDSSATAKAQLTLSQLSHAPRGPLGAPTTPCTDVAFGDVGPLQAPYRECAVSTNEGHFVTYDSLTTPGRGLGYTDAGAATFPDECSRHLVGEWWMFVEDRSGLGNCPIGYQFHGGG
jgi:hypothetical protein